jgi:hypothetical protein
MYEDFLHIHSNNIELHTSSFEIRVVLRAHGEAVVDFELPLL